MIRDSPNAMWSCRPVMTCPADGSAMQSQTKAKDSCGNAFAQNDKACDNHDANGRGLFLAKAFFPNLIYNERGNEVTFRYHFRERPPLSGLTHLDSAVYLPFPEIHASPRLTMRPHMTRPARLLSSLALLSFLTGCSGRGMGASHSRQRPLHTRLQSMPGRYPSRSQAATRHSTLIIQATERCLQKRGWRLVEKE